ncbi:hypothetical protein HDU92_003950 [Lobulomyces angularis]|nr:hypothetical protein HDU92_003950 [Lobulomyces angularis]
MKIVGHYHCQAFVKTDKFNFFLVVVYYSTQFRKGKSIKSICVRNKITRATFYNWRKQWDESGIVKPLKKTGPKLILDKESKQELIEFFNKYPTATNEDGSIHVSNKIKPRTMSVSDEPENYLDERILQETKDYLDIIKNIPNETRVYMDESFVYDNEAPRYGRSISGQRKSRPRKRHGKRWTFYLALRLNGIVHDPLISTKNARAENFLDYVRNTLVPNLQEGELVIWDRLGKAGRCKNPKKQHYNPEAKALIEAKEQGLYFYHHKERTLKTNIRISYTLSDAESCDKNTETAIKQYFRERGDGREFKRLYPDLL